VIRTYNQ
jgi:hypothetical protein